VWARPVGSIVRSAGLLLGRTHFSGTAVSLVGGDPGVLMSHTHTAACSTTISQLADGLGSSELIVRKFYWANDHSYILILYSVERLYNNGSTKFFDP
jgi:hypothetical protein